MVVLDGQVVCGPSDGMKRKRCAGTTTGLTGIKSHLRAFEAAYVVGSESPCATRYTEDDNADYDLLIAASAPIQLV